CALFALSPLRRYRLVQRLKRLDNFLPIDTGRLIFASEFGGVLVEPLEPAKAQSVVGVFEVVHGLALSASIASAIIYAILAHSAAVSSMLRMQPTSIRSVGRTCAAK